MDNSAPLPETLSMAARLATGHLKLGIAYVDRSCVVRSSNPVYQQYVAPGGPPVSGRPLAELFGAEEWQAIKPRVDAALAGAAVRFERRLAGLGEPVYWQIYYLPEAGPSGDVAGFLVLVEDVSDARRAEVALQVSEATVRAVFEAATQAIIAVGRGGRIEFHNRMAETMFGYASGQLVGAPLEELLPARFAEGHAAHRSQYFESPRTRPMGVGLDLVARRGDGSEFPVEVSLSSVRRADGSIQAIAFVSDVSQRKRLEEERNQFFNLSADLNCVAGLDGYFKQVNRSFRRCLSWSDEELMSQQFINFVHADDRAATESVLSRLREGEQVAEFVNRYRCKDGSYRWLSWTTPPPDPGSGIVFAAARDVTGERRAQAERQRLIALIESSSDLIALVSPAGRIRFLNAAGCALAGYVSLSVAQNTYIGDLFDMTGVQEAVERGERWRGEVSLRNRVTGEVVPLDMNAFELRVGDEPVWALVARDIRRRKRDQERLQALTAQLLNVQEEERRRIARDLHDDITQKLAMLGIEFGLINRDLVASNASTEQKMASLHDQILQLSEDVRQISHQLHPSVLEHSGLGAALEAFCREMSKQTGIRISAVSRDVPASLPQPVAVGLYRIAQEAVRNVFKHANASTATVTLSGGPRSVRLSVIDDGGGFDAAAMEAQPGIGMVSMQERARLINGKLTIDSQPGEGTRLVVDVDLASA